MAPALTQTEPPNLADTTCHTSDSNTITSLPYDNLKALKIKSPQHSKEFCESEQTLTSNGDCVSSSLAPPACGWAEGRPLPNSSPTETNMDERSPLPLSNSGNTHTSSVQTSSNSNMGLQTHVANFQAASSLIEKIAEAGTNSHEGATTALGNQNELLALVGRDFDNVNEIIDTLQRLASNPELLDAAAQELEPQRTNNSQNAQTQNQTPEDCATLTVNRLLERQRKLERRRQFLLRRLRRVTGRGLGMTISSQINYMTRHIGGLLEEERMKKRQQCVKEHIEEPIGLEMLHKESMKSMSTSDLISLVRRVEASNNKQRMNDKTRKAFASEEISTIPTPLAVELDTVASEMKSAVLAHVSHDSDATESSSGGESCDESELFSDINMDYKPIKERAFYKYCRNRGWVVSRWMWLQAQIADLDFRILQQQKFYGHLRKNKGVIQLLDESQHTKNQTHLGRSPAHLNMQDPALTCIGSPMPRTVLNGYHPSTKIEDMNSLNGYASGHEVLNVGCARTLGIHKVKRRRYIRPNVLLKRSVEGISNNSTNKFIKVSPVFCKCVPPLTCVLCVKFRTSNKNHSSNYGNIRTTLSKSGVNSSLSIFEKLSKNDPGFHSVLSRISEIEQGDVYSSLLKSSDWQQKCLVCKPVAMYQRENLPSSFEILDHPILKKKKKDKEHKRNGRRKHSIEDSKERITLKIKKSMLVDTLEQENTLREAKRKLEDSESPGDAKKNFIEEELVDCDDESESCQVSVSDSANSSPCPSPAFHEKGSKGGQSDMKNNRKLPIIPRQKQNSTSSSYDINNIVIPYSMAAASRVELIQYKEIPTPKWRVEEISPLSLSQRNDAELEMVEDISDETIAIRHRKSEIEEHKKYLHYYNSLSNAARSSRVRRADSSGTNTPDHPLSPRPSELMLETSPVGSPPDTPLTPQCVVASESTSTVLTFSLSSLKSSLLKSIHQLSSEAEGLSDSSGCNLSSLQCQPKTLTVPPSSSLLESGEASLPASRTRRSQSTTVSSTLAHPHPPLSLLSDEQSDKERVSPFPSRNFPLKENEYQDLVCVVSDDSDSNNNNSNTNNNDSGEDEDENSVNSSHSEERQLTCTTNHTDTVVEQTGKKDFKMDSFSIDEESGRGSPLSELTDSAPEQEEEGSWEERSSATQPDWTISAVNDQCGGFVLTVQKN